MVLGEVRLWTPGPFTFVLINRRTTPSLLLGEGLHSLSTATKINYSHSIQTAPTTYLTRIPVYSPV